GPLAPGAVYAAQPLLLPARDRRVVDPPSPALPSDLRRVEEPLLGQLAQVEEEGVPGHGREAVVGRPPPVHRHQGEDLPVGLPRPLQPLHEAPRLSADGPDPLAREGGRVEEDAGGAPAEHAAHEGPSPGSTYATSALRR